MQCWTRKHQRHENPNDKVAREKQRHWRKSDGTWDPTCQLAQEKCWRVCYTKILILQTIYLFRGWPATQERCDSQIGVVETTERHMKSERKDMGEDGVWTLKLSNKRIALQEGNKRPQKAEEKLQEELHGPFASNTKPAALPKQSLRRFRSSSQDSDRWSNHVVYIYDI